MVFATQKLGPKLAKILLAFLVVMLAAVGLTLLASWHMEGGAAAINDVGSLRMRSYRIAYALADGRQAGQAVARSAVETEIRAFEDKLAGLRQGDPSRPLFLPANDAIRAEMARIESRWQEEVKPLVVQALEARDAAPPMTYHHAVDGFVAEIDALVQALERDNAHNTALLRAYQFVLLAMVLIGVVALIYLMYLLVVRPVAKLQEGIQHMAEGDLRARLAVETEDEFGALAEGFNRMAGHLESLYGTLEERVQAKTRTLEEKNRELAALYEISTLFNEPLPEEDLCRGFVRKLIEFTGADGAAVRLVHPGIQDLLLYVKEGPVDGQSPGGRCAHQGECLCGDAVWRRKPVLRASPPGASPLYLPCAREDFRMAAVFTIQAQKKFFGVYNLYFHAARTFEPQVQQLLETFGQHLGVALENQRLVSREKELAISEERNLLAQELHDSIAQSLAFLNIQAQLLQDSLRRGDMAEAREGVAQIREGVQESYDDVRELLVHFRTRLKHADLDLALASTLEKFEGQTGIRASFTGRRGGLPLPPEHEIQVLHIVQEALSNVRKHANAEAVSLEVRRDNDTLFHIRDDGQGFDPLALDKTDSHVGLKIMRERAHRIGGKLQVKSIPGHGTEVTLTLPVREVRAA